MRLFTALWPSPEATRHLDTAVRTVRNRREHWERAVLRTRGFRFVPPERWHLTLRFHGDDADPEWLGARLTNEVARLSGDPGFRPPQLRMAGAGLFRGVLWVGVEPVTDDDTAALEALVEAAGGEPGSFRAHLTVARWAAGRVDRDALTGLFDSYEGPRWSADEVALVRTDRQSGTYRTVRRVAVTRGSPGPRDRSGS